MRLITVINYLLVLCSFGISTSMKSDACTVSVYKSYMTTCTARPKKFESDTRLISYLCMKVMPYETM